MSDVNGQLADRVRLHVPRYGSWRAEVWLSSGTAPTGDVTLTVADQALVGTVERGGEDTADRPSLVVVGGIGWERPLTVAMSYQSDAGVRLSTVLTDLAAMAGEPIEQPSDLTIGQHFEAVPDPRSAVLLRDVLEGLRRTGSLGPWRVDPDGVTRFGTRTGNEVTARATEMRRNAALGLRWLGIDSVAAFLPGSTLDGDTIERVTIHDSPEELQAEVWTSTRTVRSSVQRMLAPQLERLEYAYPRTYVVASVRADKRLDLVPPEDASHLPELQAVERWGLGVVKPAVSSRVVVVFRDANPARPVVVALDGSTPVDVSLQSSGDMDVLGGSNTRLDATSGGPGSIIIGNPLAAPSPLGAARTTDTVSGTNITGGSLKVLVEA